MLWNDNFIKTHVTESSLLPQYYIGSAAVNVLSDNEKWETMCGFSCTENYQQAELIAKYELLERLISRYDIQKRLKKEISHNTYSLLNIYSHKKIGICPPGKLFIEPNPFSVTGAGASGLALACDIEGAVKHAVFELIERHLCSYLWYTNDIHIYKIFPTISLDNYKADFYSIYEINIPFVMTVITSFDKKTICLGHAVKETFIEAKEKSFTEAVMMLDNLLKNKDGVCTNDNTKKRIFSLRSEKTRIRLSILKSKEILKLKLTNVEKPYSLREIVQPVCCGDNEDIVVSILYEKQNDDLCVVRAVSDSLHTLTFWRYQNPGNIELKKADPFC